MMKYSILLFIAMMPLFVWGQPRDTSERKTKIEKWMESVYTVREFRRMADSLQMTVSELCDYPVIFPVKKPACISSGFGMRYHPICKVRRFHTGIDIPKAKGAPVYATGNGIVIRKGYCPGYGNYIEIQHTGGFYSFYAHLSKTVVNVGDSVEIAEQIACVGSTGISTGCHLHYEIRKGKRFLNPIGWCSLFFEIVKTENRTPLTDDIQRPEYDIFRKKMYLCHPAQESIIL